MKPEEINYTYIWYNKGPKLENNFKKLFPELDYATYGTLEEKRDMVNMRKFINKLFNTLYERQEKGIEIYMVLL